MSSLPTTNSSSLSISIDDTTNNNNNNSTIKKEEHRPTISISSSSSSPATSNTNTTTNTTNNGKNNHLLKSFFLKIFHKSNNNSNSNELKRNQSFFDRFKRKNKNKLNGDDHHDDDISPSGASSLSLNDLPDVTLVNDDDDDDHLIDHYDNKKANSGGDNSKIIPMNNSLNTLQKKDYLYLYNYNSNILNIYNTYKSEDETLKCIEELNDHSDDINCILNFDFNLFTGSHDNSINYYKINENGNLNLITKFQDESNTLESLTNYKKLNLISGSRDKIIRIRNLEDFNLLTKLEGHTSWIHCVYGGSDNLSIPPLYESHIFSSQRSTNLNESDIYIWNIEYGNIVQKLHGHESTVYKMSQINSLLVSASQDCTIKLWDLKSNQLVGDIKAHNDWVKDIVIPNNIYNTNTSGKSGSSAYEIVSCSMDGSIKLWDIRKMSSSTNNTNTTTTTSTSSNNNQSNNSTSSSSTCLIETLYQNENIGFTCIYPHDSKYWYFGSNQSGKLHLYDWNDKKLKELNLDKDITIDGIC